MPKHHLERLEERSPMIAAVIVTVLMVVWGSTLIEWALSKGWAVENIYSAIFGLSAITSGALLTFYVAISAKPHPTLERLQNHPKFLDYKRYVKSALVIGIALAIITIPYMVIEPLILPLGNLLEDYTGLLRNAAVAAWFGLSAAALVAFGRVVSNFFLIMDMNLPPRRGAG